MLHYETRIPTNLGLLLLSDFTVILPEIGKKELIIADISLLRPNGSTITADVLYNAGKVEGITLWFNGLKLSGSKEHIIRILKDSITIVNKKLEDIEIGDKLLLQGGFLDNQIYCPFIPISLSDPGIFKSIPTLIQEKEARFLAYLFCYGLPFSDKKKNLCLRFPDKNVYKNFVICCDEMQLKYDKKDIVMEVNFKVNPILLYLFESWGIFDNNQPFPEFLWRSPKSVVYNFLLIFFESFYHITTHRRLIAINILREFLFLKFGILVSDSDLNLDFNAQRLSEILRDFVIDENLSPFNHSINQGRECFYMDENECYFVLEVDNIAVNVFPVLDLMPIQNKPFNAGGSIWIHDPQLSN